LPDCAIRRLCVVPPAGQAFNLPALVWSFRGAGSRALPSVPLHSKSPRTNPGRAALHRRAPTRARTAAVRIRRGSSMIVFGLLCAALMIVALLFIFPPLLKPELRDHAAEVKAANLAVYRDQLRELDSDLQNGIISKEQHAQDRNEIERRLLSDVANDGKTDDKPKTEMSSRKLAYALVVVMPIASVLLYLKVGTRQALSAAPRSTATASSQSGDMTQERIEANVAALEKKLEQNPNDGPGWSMLARSYSAMSRHKEASAAFEKAAALDPRNADLLTEYAFSLSMARGQDMEGKPIELLN